MKSRRKPLPLYVWVVLALWVVGCADRPGYMNSDERLRKTSAQFSAQAVKLHPFPTTAPSGGEAVARVEVSYGQSLIRVANLSDTDWTDMPLWVNEKYVIMLPSVPKKTLKTILFQMLFDDNGNYFPTDHAKSPVKKVHILMDDKLYSIPVRLED